MKNLSVSTPEIHTQLIAQFGEHIADQLNERRFAPIPHDDGGTVPYVRAFPEAGSKTALDRPIVYVPGFTEGEVAKVPFAAALVEQGATVLFPGQNRREIVKHGLLGKSATCAQARNVLSVIRHEGLEDGGFDVVTHSYGSLIFESMVALTEGQPTFNGARVVMLAPAGLNADEGPVRLAARFAHSGLSESRLREQEFEDTDGSMLRAGVGNMTANVFRSFHETQDLYRNRLGIRDVFVRSRIGSLAIVPYAQDRIFPYKVLDRMVSDAMDAGLPVTCAVPYSAVPNGRGVVMGAREATHNDEQFQPRRVARTTIQLLTRAL